MKRPLALLSCLGTVLAAPAAAACPVCAQRQEGPLGTIALGVFIFMPWLIAITVGHYIRKNSVSGASSSLRTLRAAGVESVESEE
jgi:hypothetical protein